MKPAFTRSPVRPVSTVRARRLALGFTQGQLARRAGLSLGYLQALEAGCLPYGDTDRLARLAEILGATVAELRETTR